MDHSNRYSDLSGKDGLNFASEREKPASERYLRISFSYLILGRESKKSESEGSSEANEEIFFALVSN